MGITSTLLKRESRSLNATEWLLAALRGPVSHTGIAVSTDSAMTNASVGSAVRLLSDTIGAIPLFVYERLGTGGKQRATAHPLYSVLHDLPNPEMTAIDMRSFAVTHLNTWGNFYGNLARDGAGHVREVWPLRPDKMTVNRDPETNQLVYSYTVKDVDDPIPLRADQVLHIRGPLGKDGILGMSPIRQYAEAIGLAMASEQYGARFFGNSGTVNGVLTHPGKLSEDAQKRLGASFKENHGGLTNAHRLLILEEGLSYQKVGLGPEEAQFLQTRAFELAEVARIFRVPLHMLYEMGAKAGSAGTVEQLGIEFVAYSIHPWLIRIEQAIYRDLLLPSERDTFFAEHLVDGLLRADTLSRYQSYAIARNNGWMSADEIRDRENLNPIADGSGKIYLIPLNMVPSTKAGEQPPTSKNPTPTDGSALPSGPAAARQRIADSFRPLFADAAERILRREQDRVIAEARRQMQTRSSLNGSMTSWLETFYAEHRDYVQRQLQPILTSLENALAATVTDTTDVAALIDDVGTTTVRDWNESSLGQLRDCLTSAATLGADPVASLQYRFALWDTQRPADLAKFATYQIVREVAR